MPKHNLEIESDPLESPIPKKKFKHGHPCRRLNHPLTGFRIAKEGEVDHLLRLINIANGRSPRTNR